MRRWLLRISLTLLALLIILIVVVQIVLATEYPKRLVLAAVQKQLGLRVSATSVSTGWFGRTTLREVTAGLPLESESFLTMPELEVTHTWLPMLIATRKVELRVLELKSAKLVVRQDAKNGRWNLQEVGELLARTGGKQQAQEQTASKSRPELPEVIVEKATVIVVDRAGKMATLEPVHFTGRPDTSAPALVYNYELTSGSILKASGQLLPGGAWKHEVKFDMKNAGKLLEPWLGAMEPVAASGQWQGESAEGGVKGRLTLERASVLSYGASGTVIAQIGPGATAWLKPQGLVITTSQKLLPEAKIISGLIRFDGDTLNADAINVQAMGGVAEATGSYSLGSKVADVTANWYGLGPIDAGIRQSGSFKAALRNPFPGNPDVQASLTSQGEVDNIGRWDTEMTLNGGGKRWNETDWKVAVSKLKWDGKFRPVDIKQLTADFEVRDQSIRLTQMHLAEGGEVSGSGSIDLASAEKKWTLALNGNGWPLPRLKQSVFEFKAVGDGTLTPRYVDIEQLYARSGDTEIKAHGTYDGQHPKPVALEVDFSNRPELQIADEQDVLHGLLIGKGTIKGTLFSTPEQRSKIELEFRLHGQELAFKDRKLGDMVIEITGEADSEQATIRSQELDLLGGRWSLGGIWKRHAEANANEDVARIQIAVRDLPLGQVGEAATGRNDVTGVAQGDFELVLPAFERPRLVGTGSFSASAVHVGDLFSADTAKGTVTLTGDQLQISPLDLAHGDGKATVTASVSLRKIKQPTIAVQAKQWMVALPKSNAELKVDADTKLVFDFQAFTAAGPFKADAAISYDGQPLGQVKLDAELAQKTLKLNSIDADAFDGKISGSATLSADAPLSSLATITWRDIDGTSVAKLKPELEGLAGKFGGTLKIVPSTDPRALGELRGDLVLDSYDGKFRTAQVGDATITAYLGADGQTDAGKPKYRFVLSDTDEDPSLIRLADGVVRVWGRVSKHGGGDTSAQLALNLDRLDVDQLVRAANPDVDKPHVARLNGRMNFVSQLNDLKRVFGTGSLEIVESDLINVPFIRELYSLVNVNFGKRKPNGRGSLDLQLDASRLGLTNIRYFNRGAEIRAEIQVADIWEGTRSPMEGSAVASLRPLKDVRLPFVADVDEIFSALQSQLGLQSVVIGGTVGKQTARPVLLSELGSGFRAIVLGEAQSQSE